MSRPPDRSATIRDFVEARRSTRLVATPVTAGFRLATSAHLPVIDGQ